MTEFLQSLAHGLGTGSVYALLALGFVIIYKSMQVISFAQPALMVSGTVLVTYLVGPLGFIPAVLLGVAGAAALGVGVERAVIRPMIGKPVFVIAIITLGVDIAIRVVTDGFIGTNVRSVRDPWGLDRASLLGVPVDEKDIAAFITTGVVVTALFLFFKYSRMGLAMRAAAFDQETALAQGVSVGTVFALSWALAGGLAGLAGTFYVAGGGLDNTTWIIALIALPAIIVGGLDSLPGAVIGGLAVGVVKELTSTYQSDFAPWLGTDFAAVTPYVLMLLVLLVRPYGLFGTKEVERV